MKTDFNQIINTIIKKVIELVKKYIRVILIGVLCMGVILSIFSIINYRHSKSLAAGCRCRNRVRADSNIW